MMTEQTKITPNMDEHLNLLALWRLEESEKDQAELLVGTLRAVVDEVCYSVTDWSQPRPLLPLSSVQAWLKARDLALEYGETGKIAWSDARKDLETELRAGYAMWKADIA